MDAAQGCVFYLCCKELCGLLTVSAEWTRPKSQAADGHGPQQEG